MKLKKSSVLIYTYIVTALVVFSIAYWFLGKYLVPLFTSPDSALNKNIAITNNYVTAYYNQTIKDYNITTQGLAEECFYIVSQDKAVCHYKYFELKPKEVGNVENPYAKILLFSFYAFPVLVLIYLLFKTSATT